MTQYEPPAVLATYSIEELCREAATAQVYDLSDLALKTEITKIDGALTRLGGIGTR